MRLRLLPSTHRSCPCALVIRFSCQWHSRVASIRWPISMRPATPLLLSALRRRGRRSQVSKQVAVRRENHGALAVHRGPIRLHRAQEPVKLRGATVSGRVDRRGLGVGLAHDFLRLAVSLGFDLLELALFPSAYLGALALSFRPVAIGDALAFGD